MREPGRHPRLPEEPPLELAAGRRAGGERQVDRLDGDRTSQRRVLGFVHDAHRSAAQLAADEVAPVPEGGLGAFQNDDKFT